MVLAASRVVNPADAPIVMVPGRCAESSRASLVASLISLPAVGAMEKAGLSLTPALSVGVQVRKSVSVVSRSKSRPGLMMALKYVSVVKVKPG